MQQETILQELNDLKRAVARAERRGRARAILGTLALAASLIVVSAPQAAAQLGITLGSLSARLDALTARTAAVEAKTKYVLVNGTDTIFRGTNVMVQSGSGYTDGTVNGLGNLIVGYNEISGQYGDERGGSHNLVVGPNHDYLSYGGLVLGYGNGIRNPYASVTGGAFNTASSVLSSFSGGISNNSTGRYSSISGGSGNFESRDSGWRASFNVRN